MKNLDRNVWCVAGIPVDAINEDEAVAQVLKSIQTRQKCFLSTPNLNFLVASYQNKNFLDSLFESDLVIADGMPLVWMSRLLKIPVKQRVTGSTLFARLQHDNYSIDKKSSVFFFGGEEGVAETACKELSKSHQLSCAGFYNPGFGSVEEMSDESIINSINAVNPDFIVVSLGAKKGQEWIQHNLHKLNASVISHLGAVVNFVAGTVDRSPVFLQKIGLEWLWRVYQEPSLWRRYYQDGKELLSLAMFRLLPLMIHRWKPSCENAACEITWKLDESEQCQVLELAGALNQITVSELINSLKLNLIQGQNLQMDLSKAVCLDQRFLGLCMMLKKIIKNNGGILEIQARNKQVRRFFYLNRAEYLLEP